jgi:hypothetical protein
MIKMIYSFLPNLFGSSTKSDYAQALEQYIVSRCPQSVAEVEHYTREFDRKQAQPYWS